MIWWTGLAPLEFEFPFPGSLISTFLGTLPCQIGGGDVRRNPPPEDFLTPVRVSGSIFGRGSRVRVSIQVVPFGFQFRVPGSGQCVRILGSGFGFGLFYSSFGFGFRFRAVRVRVYGSWRESLLVFCADSQLFCAHGGKA
jgi:hypothetical protein